MLSDHCCNDMRQRVEQVCDFHPDPANCPDSIVTRDSHGRYGIRVHDGGSSYIVIEFCPWCGENIAVVDAYFDDETPAESAVPGKRIDVGA